MIRTPMAVGSSYTKRVDAKAGFFSWPILAGWSGWTSAQDLNGETDPLSLRQLRGANHSNSTPGLIPTTGYSFETVLFKIRGRWGLSG